MTPSGIAFVLGLATTAAASASAAEAALPSAVQFNRDVRPIMVNTCFKCHGPDLKANKADLRLDLPEKAKAPRTDKTGRTTIPIVPGKPESSEVWRRISSADSTQSMPPPDSLHLLSPRDKEVFRRWIEQGAVYEPHWAYLAPRAPAGLPPAGPQARNEVDRFIQAELAARGLAPSPEADPRTLIRRLSLDLLGLPPSVAETDAFLADTRPGAYERVVDRMLASPHYGERMAVGWLDLARFADTVGFHGDQQYNNFPYRDYVIDAFNENEPFDQFTREQIAGDLLPGATERQRVASGFNRLNMVTREGGAQPKEYIARYAADRVRTISTTWLGSTMGCCECHDHKYDPFKTRDFYAMAAYFSDIKQWGVYESYAYSLEPELKGLDNDSPFPPEIEIDSPYLKARVSRLREECRAHVSDMARAIAADPVSAAAAREWAARVAPALRGDAGGWSTLPIIGARPKSKGEVTILPDQSARFTIVKPEKATNVGDGLVVTMALPAGPAAMVRMEVLPDPTFDGRVTNNAEDDSFTLSLDADVRHAGADMSERLDLAEGYPDQPTRSYSNGRMKTSVVSDWASPPALLRKPQSVEYVLGIPANFREGDRLVATIASENVGRVRFSVSALGYRIEGAPAPAEIAGALSAAAPTPQEMQVLAAEYYKGTAGGHPYEFGRFLELLRYIAECRDGRAFTTVTVATTPAVTRVLARGNWQDETGEIVAPSPPRFLLAPGAAPPAGTPRQTRLDLANWLVSRDNPLTARTFVNRLWKQFFGSGLSGIVDDLGSQGEYPSHPELLDWLAVDFMDRGWDVKAMVRTIVTSATYRQSSRYRADLAEIDPNNRLLARQMPRRLEAEFVRDNALSAAGLIDLEIGGPSVFPYQPEGYYAALQFPDRDYLEDSDERQYRRGVYMHWQRTFLHPMLANFDAPSREECTASRVVSSTPQQALTLLNDPTFVEAARALAEHSLAAHPGADFGVSLNEAFLRLLARPASERETDSLRRFFEGQLTYYRSKPAEADKALSVGRYAGPGVADAPTLAAWASVARVLLNLNEAIVRY